MVDKRKFDTAELLAQGILNKPVPVTDIPEDRVHVGIHIYEDDEFTKKNITAELVNNKVVECAEYYGIPVIWHEGGKYRAILLQYRNVTENHTFDTADEAVDWFMDTANEVSG